MTFTLFNVLSWIQNGEGPTGCSPGVNCEGDPGELTPGGIFNRPLTQLLQSDQTLRNEIEMATHGALLSNGVLRVRERLLPSRMVKSMMYRDDLIWGDNDISYLMTNTFWNEAVESPTLIETEFFFFMLGWTIHLEYYQPERYPNQKPGKLLNQVEKGLCYGVPASWWDIHDGTPQGYPDYPLSPNYPSEDCATKLWFEAVTPDLTMKAPDQGDYPCNNKNWECVGVGVGCGGDPTCCEDDDCLASAVSYPRTIEQ